MDSSGTNLLSRLLRPSDGQAALGPGVAGPRAPGASAGDFASLLKHAQSGQVSSGIPVTVSPRLADVQLSESQLSRLSAAADKAEASGMTRAVALLDGQAYVLEVQTRTISSKIDPSKDALTGIDGVIGVPPASGVGGALHGVIGGAQSALLSVPRVPAGISGMVQDVLNKVSGVSA